MHGYGGITKINIEIQNRNKSWRNLIQNVPSEIHYKLIEALKL